jgi:hypothetical protein
MIPVPDMLGARLAADVRIQYPPEAVRCAFVGGTRYDCETRSHYVQVGKQSLPHVDYYHVYVKHGKITGVFRENRAIA